MICEIITCIGVLVLLALLILIVIKNSKEKSIEIRDQIGEQSECPHITEFYQPVVGSVIKGMVWLDDDGTYYTLTSVKDIGVWVQGEKFSKETEIRIKNVTIAGKPVKAWVLGTGNIPFTVNSDNSIMINKGLPGAIELYYNLPCNLLAQKVPGLGGGLYCLQAVKYSPIAPGFPPIAQFKLVQRNRNRRNEVYSPRLQQMIFYSGASKLVFYKPSSVLR